MKRIPLLLTIMFALSASAQEGRTRERIENVSDYSVLAENARTHRVGSVATAPLSVFGSPKVPVILVQFDDVKFTADILEDATIEHSDENVNALYNRICNDPELNGNVLSYNSIREYFNQQSDGQFTPEFTVIGPVTLSQSYAYYGQDSGSSKDKNINAFYSEACKLAVSKCNVNWTQFDNKLDGVVDFVLFIYAGESQNAHNNPAKEDYNPDLIWPKESVTKIEISDGDKQITFGGYGCTGELYKGAIDGIGTMCHELSHALGLPDMYDTASKLYGLDYLDVMDSGCYQIYGRQPCCYSAYERDFIGWRALETIEAGKDTTIILDPIESGGKGLKILNEGQPNGNEYFILENRQNIKFDGYYGCQSPSVYNKYGTVHGLLISHVDYSSSAWLGNRVNSEAGHQRLTPVPADGKLVSSYGGYTEEYYTSLRGDLYPGKANVTEMSSYQVFTGTFGQRISGITENEDKTITVVINNGSPTAIASVQQSATSVQSIYSLSGQPINSMQKGVNIIRMSDGTIKKVLNF